MAAATSIPPGIVLFGYLEANNITRRELARELGWSPNRISEIVNGERSITAETAIGLGKRFGTTAEFWMTLQSTYDLARAGYVREIKVMEEDNGNV